MSVPVAWKARSQSALFSATSTEFREMSWSTSSNERSPKSISGMATILQSLFPQGMSTSPGLCHAVQAYRRDIQVSIDHNLTGYGHGNTHFFRAGQMSRDPVFDPKHFQIVCEAVGLERVQYLFLKLNVSTSVAIPQFMKNIQKSLYRTVRLHSASDVVFDCCAHAHIGRAGDEGETGVSPQASYTDRAAVTINDDSVLINIKMTTHDKMASPSWLNEKFMEQALREGKKDPKISVKHIDIKMATTPERILILQDLAEQGFKLDRSHKGFDLKQSMLVMSFLGRFHAASVILKEQDPTLMNDYMTSYWAESKNVDGPTGHWIFTMMMVLSREIESWPGFSENVWMLSERKEYARIGKCGESDDGLSTELLFLSYMYCLLPTLVDDGVVRYVSGHRDLMTVPSIDGQITRTCPAYLLEFDVENGTKVSAYSAGRAKLFNSSKSFEKLAREWRKDSAECEFTQRVRLLQTFFHVTCSIGHSIYELLTQHTPSKKIPSTTTPELALREQQCFLYLAVPPSSPPFSYVRIHTTIKHLSLALRTYLYGLLEMATKNGYINPTWLTENFIEQALREGDHDPEISVNHIDIRAATAFGDNYCSLMYRVAAKFDRGNGNYDECSLIVKDLPFEELQRKVFPMVSFHRSSLVQQSNVSGATLAMDHEMAWVYTVNHEPRWLLYNQAFHECGHFRRRLTGESVMDVWESSATNSFPSYQISQPSATREGCQATKYTTQGCNFKSVPHHLSDVRHLPPGLFRDKRLGEFGEVMGGVSEQTSKDRAWVDVDPSVFVVQGVFFHLLLSEVELTSIELPNPCEANQAALRDTLSKVMDKAPTNVTSELSRASTPGRRLPSGGSSLKALFGQRNFDTPYGLVVPYGKLRSREKISVFLATDPEVPYWIPDAYRFLCEAVCLYWGQLSIMILNELLE
uniref:Uncharacterized protein n=1 Tax=Timema monikensis TaxID=170555 RepID=A0A7R9HJ43_9NEOP|nr:unnamed protein product [Timema monikensis]